MEQDQITFHIRKSRETGEYVVTARYHNGPNDNYFTPDEDDAVYTALTEARAAKFQGHRVYFTQGALNRIQKYEPSFTGYGRLG